jgi:hypothetical protein
MKEYASIPGEYIRTHARPHAIQSILNVEHELDSIEPSAIAEGLGLWPMFLNDKLRFAPSAEIPESELSAAALADGLLAILKGS